MTNMKLACLVAAAAIAAAPAHAQTRGAVGQVRTNEASATTQTSGAASQRAVQAPQPRPRGLLLPAVQKAAPDNSQSAPANPNQSTHTKGRVRGINTVPTRPKPQAAPAPRSGGVTVASGDVTGDGRLDRAQASPALLEIDGVRGESKRQQAGAVTPIRRGTVTARKASEGQ